MTKNTDTTETYPVHASFVRRAPNTDDARTVAGMIKDYEHGVADVEDLGVTLEQYAAVALDVLNGTTDAQVTDEQRDDVALDIQFGLEG